MEEGTLPREEGTKIDLGMSLFREHDDDCVVVVVLSKDGEGGEGFTVYDDHKATFSQKVGMLHHAAHLIEHEDEEENE